EEQQRQDQRELDRCCPAFTPSRHCFVQSSCAPPRRSFLHVRSLATAIAPGTVKQSAPTQGQRASSSTQMSLRFCPTSATAAKMTRAMSATIKAYSTAVAPLSARLIPQHWTPRSMPPPKEDKKVGGRYSDRRPTEIVATHREAATSSKT